MIAIDPGKTVCYGALFDGADICYRHILLAWPIDHSQRGLPLVVIEKPSVMNVPNVADMAEVRWTGAMIAGALSSNVVTYEPSVWKGSVKKPIHHFRGWQVMTLSERALFPENAEQLIAKACAKLAQSGKVTNYSHEWTNFLDAVLLGMFHLGRIKRGGAKGEVTV